MRFGVDEDWEKREDELIYLGSKKLVECVVRDNERGG
jgi:hypothetical protein